jgi:hypothetical protein
MRDVGLTQGMGQIRSVYGILARKIFGEPHLGNREVDGRITLRKI